MDIDTLPDLTGSTKQIAWADDIRRRQIAVLTDLIEKTRDQITREPEKTAMLTALIDAVHADIPRHDTARWWIDEDTDAYRTIWSVGVAAALKVQP